MVMTTITKNNTGTNNSNCGNKADNEGSGNNKHKQY